MRRHGYLSVPVALLSAAVFRWGRVARAVFLPLSRTLPLGGVLGKFWFCLPPSWGIGEGCGCLSVPVGPLSSLTSGGAPGRSPGPGPSPPSRASAHASAWPPVRPTYGAGVGPDCAPHQALGRVPTGPRAQPRPPSLCGVGCPDGIAVARRARWALCAASPTGLALEVRVGEGVAFPNPTEGFLRRD